MSDPERIVLHQMTTPVNIDGKQIASDWHPCPRDPLVCCYQSMRHKEFIEAAAYDALKASKKCDEGLHGAALQKIMADLAAARERIRLLEYCTSCGTRNHNAELEP